ncbi:MAG: hypothetical protein MUF21_01085 [Gemmatimonadaceae bacterium]|nr:hypothetical protein [Gemmatimonadaceae bacterium]
MALYRNDGASVAARELGVSRQTIYNLVAEYQRRLDAAGGSVNQFRAVFYERQDNWERRQGVRSRQQQFRERCKERASVAATGSGQVSQPRETHRVPEYLQERLSMLKRVRALCPAVMRAMREDAVRCGGTFIGWDDEQVAAVIFRVMRTPLISDASSIARALCLFWRVERNDLGRWIPEIQISQG